MLWDLAGSNLQTADPSAQYPEDDGFNQTLTFPGLVFFNHFPRPALSSRHYF